MPLEIVTHMPAYRSSLYTFNSFYFNVRHKPFQYRTYRYPPFLFVQAFTLFLCYGGNPAVVNFNGCKLAYSQSRICQKNERLGVYSGLFPQGVYKAAFLFRRNGTSTLCFVLRNYNLCHWVSVYNPICHGIFETRGDQVVNFFRRAELFAVRKSVYVFLQCKRIQTFYRSAFKEFLYAGLVLIHIAFKGRLLYIRFFDRCKPSYKVVVKHNFL